MPFYIGHETGSAGTYRMSNVFASLVSDGVAYVGGNSIGPGGSGVLDIESGNMTFAGKMIIWGAIAGTQVSVSSGSLTVGSLSGGGSPTIGIVTIGGGGTLNVGSDNTDFIYSSPINGIGALAKGRLKRGGGGDYGRQRVELSAVEAVGLTDDVLALHDALEKLESLDPRMAQVVKLRFFARLTNEQAAQVLEVSPATAYSDWVYARCCLRLEISGEPHELPAPPPGSDSLET